MQEIIFTLLYFSTRLLLGRWMQGAVVTVTCRRHTRSEDATFRVNVASFFSLARRATLLKRTATRANQERETTTL